MKLYHIGLLYILLLCEACSTQSKQNLPTAQVKVPIDSLAWIDTVRFNNKLTDRQQKLVYLVRNNEEDYEKLKDTNRVALRFFWWRAFNPYVVVRVENRPQIYDSSGVRKLYQEWFALYKEDITQLNDDCPVRKENKCFGKPFPFVHQQQVAILPLNETTAIINKLNTIGFWQMKPEYNRGIHTDGSNWILEVYYKGRYKQVEVDLSAHPVKDVCLEMLRLTGKKLDPKEIY
ncbi:hypothetical protein [uncultured Hymenobacter sp.]|uniref:hypothetical protein n=1 Tax=uncultured Hymenobacter sp. TaxID=170016 RepID=UPI0035CA220E